MTRSTPTYRYDTVVVGGGQAGLAMGYFLARRGRSFVILDAGARIGDVWRQRWDTLRLFTPAAHSALPGMAFPAPRSSFPTKDEVAAYLERYAEAFALPVRLGMRVDALSRFGDGYLLGIGDERLVADHVVVATGSFHTPRIPDVASQVDPHVVQFHSVDYRNPDQLPEGDVLVVGASNSGAEIAVELARTRKTYLAGRDTGHIPLSLIHNRFSLWLASRVLTVDTPLGRKLRAGHLHHGDPLVRVTPRDLIAAGIERVPRVTAVSEGRPVLADGRMLEVAVVIWATGYRPDFSWIDLPIFDGAGSPIHQRGVIPTAPGLYFLGLPFQSSPTSTHIGGVGSDARHLANHVAAHTDVAGRFPLIAALRRF
jgi:putative flavoprotein involved in K+ transport